MTGENVIYRCKYCQVQVVSRTNTKAKYGKEHRRRCPRRFK